MAAIFSGFRRQNLLSCCCLIAHLLFVGTISTTKNGPGAEQRQQNAALGYDLGPQFKPSSGLSKCCGRGELLSLRMGGRCVPAKDGRRNSRSFAGNRVGLPRNRSYYVSTEYTIEIDHFFPNGSLKVGSAHLERSDYCIDAREPFPNFVLIVSKRGSLLRMIQPRYFLIWFGASLLLMVVTLTIHLAIPELRGRVHDKCFICYLAFLSSSGLILGSFIIILYVTPDTRCLLFLRGFIYTTISTFCWLNAMCIHLWRRVTNMQSISGRSFYAYALYAITLPLIVMYIGENIFGLIITDENFLYRIFEGHFHSDRTFEFFVNILAGLQFINILAFVRVAFIIWHRKRRPVSDPKSHNHIAVHITRFSQLSRLFVIMGLDWINVLLITHIDESNYIFRIIYKYFNLCPGYLIFIMFVLRNKQVISALKKRYHYIVDK